MRFAAVDLAEGLGKSGEIEDGLAAIDDAIARAERTEELWQFPELLRAKGELLLLPAPFRVAAAAGDCSLPSRTQQPAGSVALEEQAGISSVFPKDPASRRLPKT
jgi:predicted ATPase